MVKTNEIKDGDIKANIVVLRSAFGKVGQKYYIQPSRDKRTGRYPECVKRVNAQGDMILTEDERNRDGVDIHYIPENEMFIIEDGKTFNLDDIYDKAEWEAIRGSVLIAEDRFAKDDSGDYIMGAKQGANGIARWGAAELYIDRPGVDAERRVTKRKRILEACNLIMNDERGYEGRCLVAKVLGRNMDRQPNADVEEYLLSIADKTPDKIINCYNGGEMTYHILFIDAKEKGIIRKQGGLYVYGEDSKTILGATTDAVITWMKSPKNTNILTQIRKDTYPEMYPSVQAEDNTKPKKSK